MRQPGTSSTGGLTYAQIADLLGVSVQRVQFIEARALRKMKKLAMARGVSLADVFVPQRTQAVGEP